MEKEDKIGCAIGFAVFIGFILVLGLIIAFNKNIIMQECMV